MVIEAGVRGARARRPGPQLIVDALPGGASFASDDAFICEREDGAPLGLGVVATLAFDGITPSQVAPVLSAAGSVRFPQRFGTRVPIGGFLPIGTRRGTGRSIVK